MRHLPQEFCPVRVVDIERLTHVQGQDLFLAVIPQHPDKGFVAIGDPAFRRRDKHSFLHVIEQGAVAFFGGLHFGDVFNHVNGAAFRELVRRVGRGGNYRKTAEAWVPPGGRNPGRLTVRTCIPFRSSAGKNFTAELPDDGITAPLQTVEQGLVGAQDAVTRIVDQDVVGNRVEGAGPLITRVD